MKKILSIVLVAVMLLACAIPAMAEGTTITLMANANDAAKSYFTAIIDMYEAETGNKVDVIKIDPDNFDTVATAKFATGDIPDIFQHFNDSNINNYNVAENFMYLNDQPWADDLTSGAMAYSTDSEGNLLGLPFWESSVSGMFYNKKIFEENGLTIPTTQQEFNDLCDALLAAGIQPICFPTNGCSWFYQFAMDPIFADDGGELLAKLNSNQITYKDIPQMTAMCEWFKMAADKGWFGDLYLTDGWSDITVLMGTGEAAMTLIWDTWMYTDLDESYGYVKEDFGIMPMFLGTADEGTYEGGNLNMLMVNKNSENVETVLEFLEFCMNPDNYNKAFEGMATVAVFKGETANVQSVMVTEAIESVEALQRVSTANPKIIGYTQGETGSAFQELFMGNVDVAGCLDLLDSYRIATCTAMGIEGF
ncbi:MAG: ABC transporter substrate-binding protein [Clostridia bacterium]|nr:ABC transporter substrate-binding protein [Clostridia bacterium]